jgi:hypothetical protein
MFKFTSSILLTEIGKPPDVAESDAITEKGHEELDRVLPLLAFFNLVQLGIWNRQFLIQLASLNGITNNVSIR